MVRVIALLTILVALVSLVTPSVAVGSRGFVAHPDALVLLQADGTYVKAPCPLTGGKRLLHCRPDMGVLPAIAFLDPAPPKPEMSPMVDAVPALRAVPPTLRPPRAA